MSSGRAPTLDAIVLILLCISGDTWGSKASIVNFCTFLNPCYTNMKLKEWDCNAKPKLLHWCLILNKVPYSGSLPAISSLAIEMSEVFVTCWSIIVEFSWHSTSELFTFVFLLLHQHHKHPHLQMGGKRILELFISISSLQLIWLQAIKNWRIIRLTHAASYLR